MNRRPLKNGRFLSPDSEGGRGDKRLDVHSVQRIESVSTHWFRA